MATLLVIDDEPNVLFSLQQTLQSDDLEVLTARTAREGLGRIRAQVPDAVILDVRLPDMSGIEAFDKLREVAPKLPVVVITAYAATETAIEAMKRGAVEYLLKPLDLPQLRDAIARAVGLSRLQRTPAIGDEPAGDPTDRIVGRSAPMQEVYKRIGRFAPQDVTVLIQGESGTGKELVARALCQHSRRASGPFLAINCAAIPETLLESELFGHERGAFTGADRRRIGKFEQAQTGSLLLDEIGDMTPATQAKVLRLLQEQRFERVGGNETIRADVRVIAATNQNLEARVAEGRFRQDLLYRLNGFTIALPPLRERREDIPLLVSHFRRAVNRDMGKDIRLTDDDALALLDRHDWPGNVRELQSVVRYAAVQALGEAISVDCLPEYLSQQASESSPPCSVEVGMDVLALTCDLLRQGRLDIYRTVAQAVDRAVVELVLRHVRGNQVQASELLGISRTTLRAKLHALGLSMERQLVPEADPLANGVFHR
ncbi:MAG: sigma-54 dependent transcriptional regulator [Gemmataceae bacterium]